MRHILSRNLTGIWDVFKVLLMKASNSLNLHHYCRYFQIGKRVKGNTEAQAERSDVEKSIDKKRLGNNSGR